MAPRNRRIVDLSAIRYNISRIREAVPPDTKVMAVVKADAYGHGAAEAAEAAISGGAEYLAVASVAEGAALRKKQIQAPILVLGAVTREDVCEGVKNHLIQTVCSPEMVFLCREAAAKMRTTAEVHMKIDSGMGRIGVRTAEERDCVLKALLNAHDVHLTGAFTHFSDADGDDEGERFTELQFRRFLEIADGLPGRPILHCSNSAAIHRHPEMGLGMVRAGISMYGYPPVSCDLDLKPCMRWYAKVNYVKSIPSGEYISYGRTWKSDHPSRIATVTCGYADGYHRSASGHAEVLIRGKRFPVIGRICMDQMMVDVTGDESVQPEDEVVLMGESGEERITAADLAVWSGTISYEILISVGSRVEREYLTNLQEES